MASGPLKILLVHGMGRTSLSMWRLARSLRSAGTSVDAFGYRAASESVDEIVDRLRVRLTEIAPHESVVIGHSLGGLLLRAAVAALPADVRRPRRIIMLGTPNHSPRLARRFEQAWWYRKINGDAGAFLAHEGRFDQLPIIGVPCTVVAGTRGINGRWSPFGAEANDGLVAVSETRLDDADEWIQLPVRHPFMMNDKRVREIVRERCN